MTAPGTSGTDDAETFRLLAGILRIPVVLGAQTDAENTAAERIVFIFDRLLKPRALKFGATDGDGIAEQARLYKVAIYTGDLGRLFRLHRELFAALDDVLSFSGFEMDNSERAEGGAAPGMPSWGVLIPVILKSPIYRKFWIPGTSSTVTTGLVVTKPDGTGGQEVGP